MTTEAERKMAAGDRRERWGWCLMGKESEIFLLLTAFPFSQLNVGERPSVSMLLSGPTQTLLKNVWSSLQGPM